MFGGADAPFHRETTDKAAVGRKQGVQSAGVAAGTKGLIRKQKSALLVLEEDGSTKVDE